MIKDPTLYNHDDHDFELFNSELNIYVYYFSLIL